MQLLQGQVLSGTQVARKSQVRKIASDQGKKVWGKESYQRKGNWQTGQYFQKTWTKAEEVSI
jgi:hypothetical protein